MGTLSKHFDRSEFVCKCGCGLDTVDFKLVEMLEQVREHFGTPVTINSGCRCPAYNAKIGGEKASQHMRGRAADIVVRGVLSSVVADFCETLAPGGLGRYNNFTHVDSRDGKARWGSK